MNRWMRALNINKVMNRLPNGKRKNNRNMWLLSLLGVGIAGGATYYSMRRGKNTDSVRNMVQKVTNQMGVQNMLKPQQ